MNNCFLFLKQEKAYLGVTVKNAFSLSFLKAVLPVLLAIKTVIKLLNQNFLIAGVTRPSGIFF